MGRPAKPPNAKRSERFCVALKPGTVDQIYQFASLQGEQAGPIVRRVLENVFSMLATTGSSSAWYGERRSPAASTVRYVLTGVRSDEAASSSLGRRE